MKPCWSPSWIIFSWLHSCFKCSSLSLHHFSSDCYNKFLKSYFTPILLCPNSAVCFSASHLFNDCLMQMAKAQMFNEDSKALNNQVTDYLSQLISHGSSQYSNKNPIRIPEKLLSSHFLLLHILFSLLDNSCSSPSYIWLHPGHYSFDWVVNSYVSFKIHHGCHLFEPFPRLWEITSLHPQQVLK